jgi:hypothetical protein
MKDGDRKNRSSFVVTLAVLTLSPVAYVLSFGPAHLLLKYKYVSFETFLVLYAPLMYVYHRVSWFEQFVNWYLSWWK